MAERLPLPHKKIISKQPADYMFKTYFFLQYWHRLLRSKDMPLFGGTTEAARYHPCCLLLTNQRLNAPISLFLIDQAFVVCVFATSGLYLRTILLVTRLIFKPVSQVVRVCKH